MNTPAATIRDAGTRTAWLMTAAHALGQNRTALTLGSDLQRHHGLTGLYVLARTWCTALNNSTPTAQRENTGAPDLEKICAESPEDHHALTYHLTHHTAAPPSPEDLTSPGLHAHATTGLTHARLLAHRFRTHTGPAEEQPAIGTFTLLTGDAARLGATLATLCTATARLLTARQLNTFLHDLKRPR